jgi:hypothetical protein
MMLIIGVIAELERGLIMERVCAGMRRAKLEGRQIGRPPLNIDRAAIMRDRGRKMSLTEIAKAHGISRALVSKALKQVNILKQANILRISTKGLPQRTRNCKKTGRRKRRPQVPQTSGFKTSAVRPEAVAALLTGVRVGEVIIRARTLHGA